MEPEENDGDDEKSEGDSIYYPTSGGDNDANDDGDDLSEDDADDIHYYLHESIPEADIPLRKRARFTTPTSRYEIGKSFVVAAAARQIWPTLTIADKREIERYVGRLPEMIRGNVMSYEPKSMQKAIDSANDQMDQKLLGIAVTPHQGGTA
nr:hypothetical protein [Tanacetum cinerariifolium]